MSAGGLARTRIDGGHELCPLIDPFEALLVVAYRRSS